MHPIAFHRFGKLVNFLFRVFNLIFSSCRTGKCQYVPREEPGISLSLQKTWKTVGALTASLARDSHRSTASRKEATTVSCTIIPWYTTVPVLSTVENMSVKQQTTSNKHYTGRQYCIEQASIKHRPSESTGSYQKLPCTVALSDYYRTVLDYTERHQHLALVPFFPIRSVSNTCWYVLLEFYIRPLAV